MKYLLLACVALLSFPLRSDAQDAKPGAHSVRVVIWDEQQPAQRQAYPEFLGEYIAAYLKGQPGISVRSVSIKDEGKGLGAAVLDECDVLIWWGHVRNGEISVEEAQPIVDRIREGKLSLIALHSAHWATPFVMAMHERAKLDALAKLTPEERSKAKVEFVGDIVRRPPARAAALTPQAKVVARSEDAIRIEITRPNCCFPGFRNDGRPSTLETKAPEHPIAAGIPKTFSLPHTEMYDEPFHVPEPDAVIFEERWELGEYFRSGMVWNIGRGKVFYFRPGHETHSVFSEPVTLQIVENAVRWLGKR
jgi:trehalose utilization protein